MSRSRATYSLDRGPAESAADSGVAAGYQLIVIGGGVGDSDL